MIGTPLSELMRQLEPARSELLSRITPLCIEAVPLPEAVGRYVAADQRSEVDIPAFDNSAMDGFAVRSSDVARVPAELRRIGTIAAGSATVFRLNAGECVRIFTGAPLPLGADSVVMQEDCRYSDDFPDRVTVVEGVKPWENIRFRGEDIRTGSTLLSAGSRIGPPQIGLLAAAGIAHLPVYRRPVVGVISSGSELRQPGEKLSPGEIYESNTAMLSALVRDVGAVPLPPRVVPDDLDRLSQVISGGLDAADAVIMVGGASVGDADLARRAVERLGGTVDFWRLAMKPGKPFFLAQVGGKWVFGLPGNPVSAFVTAVMMVLPALRRYQGAIHCDPPVTLGTLSEPLGNSGDRRHFVRVRTKADGAIETAGIQASHMLASLSGADGLVDVAPFSSIPAGTVVPVIRW